jgi:hypothetical protein
MGVCLAETLTSDAPHAVRVPPAYAEQPASASPFAAVAMP